MNRKSTGMSSSVAHRDPSGNIKATSQGNAALPVLERMTKKVRGREHRNLEVLPGVLRGSNRMVTGCGSPAKG